MVGRCFVGPYCWVFKGCLEGVLKVSETCLEGVRMVFLVVGGLVGGCLEGVLKGVWMALLNVI